MGRRKIFSRQVDGQNMSPLLGEELGTSLADTRGGTGDNGGTVFKTHGVSFVWFYRKVPCGGRRAKEKLRQREKRLPVVRDKSPDRGWGA
jgi:hypothetical protein